MSTLFAAALAWEGRGRLDLAIAEYDRLVEAGEGGAETLVKRAMLHEQLGAFATMSADLERAQRIAPENPYPSLWLGHIATAMGRHYLAIRHLRAALAVADASHAGEMRVNLVACYIRLDWLDLADREARALPQEVADWWANARRTALSRHREEHRETLAILRRRREPQDMILVRWHLAQKLFVLGRLKVARTLCEGLMRQVPDSFPTFLLYSRIIARESGAEAALAFLHALRWLHGDHPDYSVSVAHLLNDAGRYEELLVELGRPAVDQTFDQVRILTATALFVLEDSERLGRYSREWMLDEPRSVTAGGFVIVAHADRVRRAAGLAPPAATPRRVHIVQFWDKEQVPADIAASMAAWRRHHPEADHTLFSAARATAFLADHFGPDTCDAFALCHHPAMQADLFRVAFLFHAGGVYVDADELCMQPLGDVLHAAADAEFAAVRSGDVPGYLHNYFLGARPGSATMGWAVADAVAKVRQDADEGRRSDIWQATGPGLVTRAVGVTLAQRGDAAVRDDMLLLPIQQYRALVRVGYELQYKQETDANWQLA